MPDTFSAPLLVIRSVPELPLSVVSATDGAVGAAVSSMNAKLVAAEVFPAMSVWRTWTVFVPSTGANSVLVRQTDVADNTSAATSFSFTLDSAVQAPVITGFGDDTGAVGDGRTSDTNLLITGTSPWMTNPWAGARKVRSITWRVNPPAVTAVPRPEAEPKMT